MENALQPFNASNSSVINVLQQTPRPVCDSQPFSAEKDGSNGYLV